MKFSELFFSQLASKLPLSRANRLTFAAVLMLTMPSCEPENGSSGAEGASPEAVRLPLSAWLPLQIDTVRIEAQIALSAAEMRRGLMFREELESDHGMLFAYAQPQAMSFWMRNTPLPLDVGFFDGQGVLREVHSLYPFDETPVRSGGDQLQFALEMNQGWFAQNKIKPGARLQMDLLIKALTARGANPEDLGLLP